VSVEAAFYFDLRSPEAYLAAERALHVLPAPCEWQPILAAALPSAETFEAYRCEQERDAAREGIELRAAALELQPLRWPAPFPYDSSFAMLAATYAKRSARPSRSRSPRSGRPSPAGARSASATTC